MELSDKQHSVFVVGAGASYEINLPLGKELKSIICGKLARFDISNNSYREIRDEVINLTVSLGCGSNSESIKRHHAAARKIVNGLQLADSIDTFLKQQRDYADREILESIAKRAIVAAILEREASSALKIKNFEFGPAQIRELDEECWYPSFYALITSEVSLSELSNRLESLIIIIFNYDRCFEHFFFNCLKRSYDLSDAEAATFMAKIKIYHPYGKVGDLPWEANGGTSVGYGEIVKNPSTLIELSKGILTFNETDAGNNELYEKIGLSIQRARQIVFLGFGYLDQNMRLLGASSHGEIHPDRILGTCKSLSEPDQKTVRDRIQKGFCNGTATDIQLTDMTCNEFMGHFRLTISERL